MDWACQLAVAVPPATIGPYEANAYAIAEGKRLYAQFNCVGCHMPMAGAEWARH